MPGRSRASILTRIALAYLLALQALLGAWVGHATGATSAFDPSLVLCRTAASEPKQDTDRDGAVPQHCAVMCLSGVCGAGDPPAPVGVAFEFRPRLARMVSCAASADAGVARLLHPGVNARGPPSIA